MTSSRGNTIWIARTALMLALTVVIQMFGLPQWFTGPAVNAMLLLAAGLINPAAGVMVGLFTPVIAVWRGILPPMLTPVVPFIAAGNAIYVLVFVMLERWHPYIGVATAAFAKFALLAAAVRLVVEVPAAIAQMMQLPQLVTALVGGAGALAILWLLEDRVDLRE